LDNIFRNVEKPHSSGSRGENKAIANLFGAKPTQSGEKPQSLFQGVDKSRFRFSAPPKEPFSAPGKEKNVQILEVVFVS